VSADDGKLLWTVPLRSPYGVNITTPVYGENRIFYTTPYVFGTCYQLQPGEPGPRPEKTWSTTLDTCTGTVLLADGLLYGSGYQKHKSWLCMDWKSGAIRYESKDLTTGAAVYAGGRLYCLPRTGERPLEAHARQVRHRRPVPACAAEDVRRLGTPRSAPRPAVPQVSRHALVLRRSRPTT